MDFHGVNQVYSETGVDLTLLRENLLRPIENRLERNSRAIHSVHAFERACQGQAQMGNSSMDADSVLNVEGLLKQLSSFQVKFVLIGGLAMRAHGSAHLTEDADFVYERSKENIQALTQAMAPLHPYLRGAPKGLPFHFDAPTIQAGSNFTLISDFGDIDFLGHVSGIGDYAKVAVLSEDKNIFGITVRVLSLEGLIAAKKAAGRAKDKSHLLELEELKKMRDAQSEN